MEVEGEIQTFKGHVMLRVEKLGLEDWSHWILFLNQAYKCFLNLFQEERMKHAGKWLPFLYSKQPFVKGEKYRCKKRLCFLGEKGNTQRQLHLKFNQLPSTDVGRIWCLVWFYPLSSHLCARANCC